MKNFILIFLFLLTSCATLSPAGKKLKIFKTETEVTEANCLKRGEYKLNTIGRDPIMEVGAENQAKNYSAKYGDSIFIETPTNNIIEKIQIYHIYVCNPEKFNREVAGELKNDGSTHFRPPTPPPAPMPTMIAPPMMGF